ncbi:DUF732 domain-containing protein [Mycobacterium botniense]|nr:DUF732 domain-containing protein [Mycobacterium botniense]
MRIAVAVTAGLGVAAAMAAPARADAIDDQFLGALNSAGVDYQDPAGTAALGQSICPMLAQPGGTFAAAASSIAGKDGISPAMADMFTSIAISMYCPSMMQSLAHGEVPTVPQLPGAPGI